MTRVVVDLDAKRAARREARGEPIVLVFGGEDFELPVELPFDVLEALPALASGAQAETAGAFIALVRSLLGDEAFTRFVAHRPSLDDFVELADAAFTAYGADQGNSSASRSQSSSAGPS